MEAQTEAITPQPKQGQWVGCHQSCAQSRQAGAWLAMGNGAQSQRAQVLATLMLLNPHSS